MFSNYSKMVTFAPLTLSFNSFITDSQYFHFHKTKRQFLPAPGLDLWQSGSTNNTNTRCTWETTFSVMEPQTQSFQTTLRIFSIFLFCMRVIYMYFCCRFFCDSSFKTYQNVGLKQTDSPCKVD